MDNLDKSYINTLDELKTAIKTAQIKAVLSVNSELVILYWNIGKIILKQQKEQGWGTKVVEMLSNDLQKSFPDMKGLSFRNLNYMRKFAQIYPDYSILQQAVANFCKQFTKLSIFKYRFIVIFNK